MKFKPCSLVVDDLLLDPNNYRFLDDPDYRKRLATRYHDEGVQNATLRILERGHSYQLKELRQSILSNGYIPLERVIVSKYPHKKGKFVVIEGNRRVAALKSLLRDHKEGAISLTADQVKSFSKIPGALLEATGDSLAEVGRVIMGLRHIVGPREWGAYQRAQLISELIDEQGMESSEVSDHLGISTVEVTRRYRAMKALKAMEKDDLYSASAKPDYYRLFHELVALPGVRERFGWDQEKQTFTDTEKAREFFDLIAPQAADIDPKLRTYADVRRLKIIIGNRIAEASLLNPEDSFNDALKIAESQKAAGLRLEFLAQVQSFESALRNLSLEELTGMTDQNVAALETIIDLIQQRVEAYRTLRK